MPGNPKPETKEFYLNPIAQLFLQAMQLVKVLIAGRGFGKSFINGIQIMMHVQNMPRSRGLFLGATYTQILTNTLLPIKSAWNIFGYVEGVHYVIGKRPPDYFQHPFMKPDRYENVISWWNGAVVILASMDRPALNRGGNNDWIVTDESLLIKREEYDRNISPSIRGSHTSLRGKKGHLSETFTSSMPFGTIGKWLLDMEALAKDPTQDTFYIEGTSWHNRVIIGDEVLKKWKRTMSPIIYLIEVMNKRLQAGSLFYPALTDAHFYTADNYSHIDNLGYEISEKRNSRWDKDCLPNEPLNISHDWGAFNCITVDQFYRSTNTLRFLNFLHVSHPEIIDDLADKFCEYYRYHKNKTVYQWGDKSGNKKEANAKQTYFDQFAARLRKKGWRVILKKVGDVEHLTRHDFINGCHRSEYPIRIEYNAINCKDLRVALETAGMKDNKKDKSSENNPNVKQEHATHGTDAHDYRVCHGFIHLKRSNIYSSPVSFGG